MKVGDLVRFQRHSTASGPWGIITRLNPLSAEIYWCDKYTPTGFYKKFLLEVIE